MSKLSKAIVGAIQREIKKQESLLKALDLQDKQYSTDSSAVKSNIKESVSYMNTILKNAEE